MARPNYCYIIVNKENGKPLVEDCRLPIYWLKLIAKERLKEYGGTKHCVQRLNLADIETLILKSKRV